MGPNLNFSLYWLLQGQSSDPGSAWWWWGRRCSWGVILTHTPLLLQHESWAPSFRATLSRSSAHHTASSSVVPSKLAPTLQWGNWRDGTHWIAPNAALPKGTLTWARRWNCEGNSQRPCGTQPLPSRPASRPQFWDKHSKALYHHHTLLSWGSRSPLPHRWCHPRTFWWVFCLRKNRVGMKAKHSAVQPSNKPGTGQASHTGARVPSDTACPLAGPAYLWNSSCAGTGSHPVAAAATSQCSNSSYHWAELGGSTSQSAEKRSLTRKVRLGEWKELEIRTKDISENSPRSRLSGTQCKPTGSCKSDLATKIARGPAEHRVNLSLV